MGVISIVCHEVPVDKATYESSLFSAGSVYQVSSVISSAKAASTQILYDSQYEKRSFEPIQVDTLVIYRFLRPHKQEASILFFPDQLSHCFTSSPCKNKNHLQTCENEFCLSQLSPYSIVLKPFSSRNDNQNMS